MVAPSRSFGESVAEPSPTFAGRRGLRALGSSRFRLLLAIVLATAGIAVLASLLLRQAADPAGQYAFDFQVYHVAAGQIAAGNSPYDASMFNGPIPAQGALLYKYPPLLAQLLVPLAGLSLGSAAAIWLVIQAAAVFSATWLAARAGGAANSAETVAWSVVATVYYLPVFDTLWKGNMSGVLALATTVALAGGLAGGFGAAAAALLKTTPVVMVLPALAAGRRALWGLVLAVPLLISSFVLSPGAWIDFARVIPNLLSGPATFSNNLAPDNLVRLALPESALVADATRLAVVALGLAAVGASIVLARRPGGWPAAVVLAVSASLLLPSATWYHYFAVLLPLAAFAWPRAGRRARLALAAGAATVTAGLAALPITVVGAAVIASSSLVAVWPRSNAAAEA